MPSPTLPAGHQGDLPPVADATAARPSTVICPMTAAVTAPVNAAATTGVTTAVTSAATTAVTDPVITTLATPVISTVSTAVVSDAADRQAIQVATAFMPGTRNITGEERLLRFATFNVLNLALPGQRFYDNIEPHTPEHFDAKLTWLAQQFDRLDADVIALQEVFSQEAVPQILARTRLYRDAVHVGLEPVMQDGKLTPAVALVSRLPLGKVKTISALPQNLAVPLPDMAQTMTSFTRPVLQAQVLIAPDVTLELFVVHLKSKRPDYRYGETEGNQYELGAAVLRSLIRRATEALGLRWLLSETMRDRHVPVMVMGDFNDTASAVSTQLVMGLGKPLANGSSTDDRLFDCYRIQSRRDPLRDIGFTHVHEGVYETIDHVLVSEAFDVRSPLAIGEVLDVTYVNDHVMLGEAPASDHGIVLVRIRLAGR